MTICVLCDYEIEYECSYTYLNEDRDFTTRNFKESFSVDGGKFLDLVMSRINDSNFFELEFNDNFVRIEYFDLGSGETSTYIYKFVCKTP